MYPMVNSNQDYIFDRDFILTNGISVKEMCFTKKETKLIDVADVIGTKWAEGGIPTFKIYGESYNNIDSFYDQLRPELTIEKLEYQNEYLLFTPNKELNTFVQEIYHFVNGYVGAGNQIDIKNRRFE